jgi:hypothetical protein
VLYGERNLTTTNGHEITQEPPFKKLSKFFFPKAQGVNAVHNNSLIYTFKSLMDVDLSRLLATLRFEAFVEMKWGKMN